jgi:hypothetical protein
MQGKMTKVILRGSVWSGRLALTPGTRIRIKQRQKPSYGGC